MTWVDLVVLAVLLTSAGLAFMRGLVREVLGIGAWIGALVIALKGLPATRDIAARWIHDQSWLDPIAFAATFLIALVVLSLVARIIGRTVRGSALGGLDRSLGLVFGLGRGAVLVIVAYVLGSLAIAIDQWPEPVLKAASLRVTYQGANWLVQQLPSDYRPQLIPPPGPRNTTADALLRVMPQGRATGVR